MDAAIRTYGEKGFRNSSVKAVCAAAGLTERYFYEWFENSEDMLRQCFERVTGDLIAMMRDTARNAGAIGFPFSAFCRFLAGSPRARSSSL